MNRIAIIIYLYVIFNGTVLAQSNKILFGAACSCSGLAEQFEEESEMLSTGFAKIFAEPLDMDLTDLQDTIAYYVDRHDEVIKDQKILAVLVDYNGNANCIYLVKGLRDQAATLIAQVLKSHVSYRLVNATEPDATGVYVIRLNPNDN